MDFRSSEEPEKCCIEEFVSQWWALEELKEGAREERWRKIQATWADDGALACTLGGCFRTRRRWGRSWLKFWMLTIRFVKIFLILTVLICNLPYQRRPRQIWEDLYIVRDMQHTHVSLNYQQTQLKFTTARVCSFTCDFPFSSTQLKWVSVRCVRVCKQIASRTNSPLNNFGQCLDVLFWQPKYGVELLVDSSSPSSLLLLAISLFCLLVDMLLFFLFLVFKPQQWRIRSSETSSAELEAEILSEFARLLY
jgi:hypothetical protein